MLLLYGLFASPDMLGDALLSLSQRLPADAAKLVGGQVTALVAAPSGGKTWGAAIALLLAVYGATKGIDGLVTALTIAFEQDENRSWLRRTGTVAALTLFAVVFAVLALSAIGALSLPRSLVPIALDTAWLTAIAGAIVLVIVATLTAAALFRFAPPRQNPQPRWFTPGALFAALSWFAVTSGLAWYAANFGNYSATWGALAGIVVLLTWLYLSAYVLLLGAALDAQLGSIGAKQP